MGLKLFRSTGHSTLLDTRTAAAWQRSAFPEGAAGRQSLGLVVWVAAWIASVGNWPLWRELSRAGQLQSPADWGQALLMVLAIWAGLCITCAPLAFRRIIKPVLIALLVLTALNATLLMTAGGVKLGMAALVSKPASWMSWVLNLVVIAGVPTLWLARQRVLKLGMVKQLKLIVVFALLALVVLYAARWILSLRMPLMLQDVAISAWVNPLGLLIR
jgi:hypothetical protein